MHAALTQTDCRPKWQQLMDAHAAECRSRETIQPLRPFISNTERRRAITLCMPMWLDELEATDVAGRKRVVERLGQALLVEDRRRRTGSWNYLPGRHRHMLAVYKRELADLNAAMARRAA